MNIAPYVPDAKLFDHPVDGFFVAIGVIAILLFLVGLVAMYFGGTGDGGAMVAMGIVIATVMFAITGSGVTVQLRNAQNYFTYSEKATQEIKDAGFRIVSGEIDFHQDAQSLVMLDYAGTNYDCTVFSPSDPKENVIFSCGPMKQTLDAILAGEKELPAGLPTGK